MRVLLDSNAYSRLMRGDDQTAATVRDATEVLMSAVVIGELLYGFRNGSSVSIETPSTCGRSWTIPTCPSCRWAP